MRIPSISRLGAASFLVLLSAALIAPAPFRLEPVTSISADDAKAILGMIRRGIDGKAFVELPGSMSEIADDQVPAVLTAWVSGVKKRVWQVEGKRLDAAVNELIAALRQARSLSSESGLRLQLDLVTAQAWIPQKGLLANLAFVEGRDGLSAVVGARRIYLPPSELIRRDKYGGFKPLVSLDPKFEIGIDVDAMKRLLIDQAKNVGVKGRNATEVRKFRALTAVEDERQIPKLLLKGTVERPLPNRSSIEKSALAGARYLTRALLDDGLFRYHYNPVTDKDVPDSYNWPRHAGVSYSLALVGRLLGKQEIVEASERALERFERELVNGPGGSRCLLARGSCYVGSAALGLLALSEYRIASGSDRFASTAARLAAFLISMQRDDGFFHHEWYPKKGVDKEKMKLYASQQAVLALARHWRAAGDDKALAAAKKGMDYLAGPYWDHFLGSYFFGQEHWTCLAAEEMYGANHDRKYAVLCREIGIHYARMIHDPRDTPFEEDIGGMSITHIFTPHAGGTATAAEAMVSAVKLSDAAGLDSREILDKLIRSLGFLQKCQVQPRDLFWIKRPEFALGGVFETQTKPRIRIDNVQHAISAMVRSLELLPSAKAPASGQSTE